MRGGTPTRRGFLAAAGGVLLAGCSELDLSSDDESETVPYHRLPDVGDEDEIEPILVETVPVDIEHARLADATQRVSELLGTLPMPFGPEDVPNGHIRQHLVASADDATACISDARTAQSRLQALESLRDARGHARYAAAGWAFVDEGTTAEELQAEHQEAVDEAESIQDSYEYVGTDPVEAALVHARIERNLDYVLNDHQSPSRYGDGPLLTVAEWGEHAETAQAHVADSSYLYERFRSSLPADAGSVEETLATAAESVTEDLRRRRDDLPPEPTEDDWGLRERLVYRLWDDAESSVERVTDADGPATAVLAATEGLTNVLAFDRLRERIDDGEEFRVTEARDVREARAAALEAIRTALEESPRPGLARPVLADAAATVSFADSDIARAQGEVRLAQLDDPVRRYTAATLRARSVSAACRQVVDALDT